jgi:hypothetical protein
LQLGLETRVNGSSVWESALFLALSALPCRVPSIISNILNIGEYKLPINLNDWAKFFGKRSMLLNWNVDTAFDEQEGFSGYAEKMGTTPR